jgi:predicted Na+-dependent transporter
MMLGFVLAVPWKLFNFYWVSFSFLMNLFYVHIFLVTYLMLNCIKNTCEKNICLGFCHSMRNLSREVVPL